MSSSDVKQQQRGGRHGAAAGTSLSDSELDDSDGLHSSSEHASSLSSSSLSPSSPRRTRRSLQRSTAARGNQQRDHKRRRAATATPRTSLWRTREVQFEQFRAATLVLPVPQTVVRVAKTRGYSLCVLSVLDWVLPDAMLHAWQPSAAQHRGGGRGAGVAASDSDGNASDADDASDDESDSESDELLVTLGVHVSLFHAGSKRFFGNTWVSPELAVDPRAIKPQRHAADASVRHVVERVALQCRAYFLSDVIDASCVGVVELVAYEKDPDSKATVSVVGCGWTLLPLFASSTSSALAGNVAAGVNSSGVGTTKPPPTTGFATGEAVTVFSGSPRVLWELPPSAWPTQTPQGRCKCYYALEQYEPLLAAAPFLRAHELVGALDDVPGLRHGNVANLDVGRSAKLLLLQHQREQRHAAPRAYAEALAAFARLAALVPRSIAVAEAVTLRVLAARVAVHLREEVEADLVARLRLSCVQRHAGAASVDGHVSARVLLLALHNGRRFRSRPQSVALKPMQPGSDHLRCCSSGTGAVMTLRGFVLHAHFALVAVLQFTVHFRIAWPAKTRQQALEAHRPAPPEEDVVVVTIGARALLPSDGRKLFLYDKHAPHATSESLGYANTPSALPLQVETVGTGGETANAAASAAAAAQPSHYHRVLHVELLSGAPCRPYSDHTLYTPAGTGGQRLERHARAAHDSIAFVDLSLAVEGNGSSATRPASPVRATKTPAAKTTRRDNQSDSDGSGEPRGPPPAERWAAKMLRKAASSTVLAQTLDALATATTAPSNQQQSPTKPASPTKHTPKPSSPSRTDPAPPSLHLPHAQTSELSRVSKTLLTRFGFMDAHDTNATSHENAGVVDAHGRSKPTQRTSAASPSKSIDVELRDVYKAHEVRVHFAAFRSVRAANTQSRVPARVYFTFQFYSFPPTRTESLRLSKPFASGGTGSDASGGQTFVLLRESPAGEPARAIQFDVDTTAARDPLEPHHFAEYLLRGRLHVDVWDTDSLFQLGTFAIPLHELLRQGSGIKKFQAEADVVEPLESRYVPPTNDRSDGGNSECCINVDDSADCDVVGKVQFLVSNYGLKGRHVLPPSAAVGTPPLQAAPATASRLGDAAQAGATTARAQVKHRVRARPLVDSNAELYRLLAHEGFYGSADSSATRERKRGGSRNTADMRRQQQQQQTRGQSDATSLSPAEVAILCDLFGAKRGVATQQQHTALARRTRIQCDLEARTGLLALLAVGPQPSAPAAVASELPTTVPVSDSVAARAPSAEPRDHLPLPNALHVDRLRRVLSLVQRHEVGLDRAFTLFDTDRDGFLSHDEFVQALRSMGAVFADVADAELRAIAAAMDADGDGRVDYKEFGAFLAAQSGLPLLSSSKTAAQWRDEVQRILVRAMDKGIAVHKIFADLDASGDGQLSYDEFGRALQKLGVPPDQEQRHRSALLREFDTDGDGHVSFREFLAALGLSLEATSAQIVRDTVEDIGATVRETLARVAAQGVELAQVFAHFDADKSRKLSVDEFTQALQQLVGQQQQPLSASPATQLASSLQTLEREALRAFVATVNVNGDDEIDYCEFLALCGISGPALAQQAAEHATTDRVATEKKLIKLLVRAMQSGMRIEQLFAHFDANADGRISLSEFQHALDSLFRSSSGGSSSAALSAQDAAAIAARFDADGDRNVSFQEFQSFAREIERLQRTLAALLMPHAARLAEVEQQTSKLALGKWQQLCTRELKLSRQDTDALKPLLTYFELLDAAKKVDLTQLCALLKPPSAASASANASDDPIARLKALLHKAKAQGLDAAKLFAEFDANGDGEVSRTEFASLLQRLGCFADVSDSERDAMLAHVDSDGSGQISLREFRTLLLDESGDDNSHATTTTTARSMTAAPPSPSAAAALLQRFTALLESAAREGFDVAKCFAHFDVDSGGQITLSEFIAGMQQLGLSGSADSSAVETLREVFESLDRDGSGEISMTEFKTLFTSTDAGASRQELTATTGESSTAEAKRLTRPQPTLRTSTQQQPSTSSSSVTVPGDTPVSAVAAEAPTATDRLRSLLQLAEQAGNDVSACFSHFDSDGDGRIMHGELIEGLKALAGFEAVTETELLALVATLDSDASGSVSLDEFRAFVAATDSSSNSNSRGAQQQPLEKSAAAATAGNATPASNTPRAEATSRTVDATTDTLSAMQNPGLNHNDEGAGDSAAPPEDSAEAPSVTTAESLTEATATMTATAVAKPRATSARPAAVRSPSFAAVKNKPPLSLAAARRAKTDSTSVAAAASDATVPTTTTTENAQPSAAAVVDAAIADSGETKSVDETAASAQRGRAPLQRASSLSAARAAKAAASRAAAKAATPAPVSAAVVVGLDRLRSLLLAAQHQGIDIRASFDHFDADANGRLTYDEFAHGVKQLGPDFEQLSDIDVDGMARALDQRQSGEVLVQDLVQLVSTPSPANVETVSTVSAPAVVATAAGDSDIVVAGPKRAPMSARTPSEGSAKTAAAQAPVRRTSSLRPPLKSSNAAAPTEAGGAPVIRTLSPKSGLKRPTATDTDGGETVTKTPAAATSVPGSTTTAAPSTSVASATPSLTAAPSTDVIANCAYTFHSDPQIRAVELKLRRAAVDAHARGVLPIRVVSKFLNQYDEEAAATAARSSRRPRKRTELLRVEFLQVLMELGLSLLSDPSESGGSESNKLDWSDSGGRPHVATRMNDTLYARQLERLSRYRHHVKEESRAQKQLVRAVAKTRRNAHAAAAEASLRRFADEKHQLLRVLSFYRDGQKKALVYSLLREQVTTTIALAPRFAALLFLELPVANPYSHLERFRLEVVVPPRIAEAAVLDVDIVKSSAEWSYYRDHIPPAFSASESPSPIEHDMIDDANEVVLDAHDRIAVPVRLRWLDTRRGSDASDANGAAATPVPASIAVRSCTHGHIVALFKLELRPQPLVCHRVLRFSHPSNSIWRVRLRCPFGKFVVCMDPSVAVESATSMSDRVVGLKCRVGEYPALEEFYLVLYDDEFYARVFEVWHVRIQAKLRIDLHAVLGQSVKSELVIRGDSALSVSSTAAHRRRRHVQCFTPLAASHEVQFRPAQIFELVPDAFNRIALSFCTTEPLRVPQYRVLVNLVDVASRELVGAWILHVTLALPRITKTYDLQLPLATPAQKKIAYANAWDEPQTIVLRSSAPTQLQPRDAVLQVPRSGSAFLRLGFPAVALAARNDIYLFINDRDTDENEECLLFRVTYGGA